MVIASSGDLIQRLQNEVLEAIARGAPLSAVNDLICRGAENLAPGVICSILAVDAGARLRPLAAPSLPDSYSQELNGLAIGPDVGSCGTAAFRGEPVEVTDIATDPLWGPFKSSPLLLGLKACWSSPIKAQNGRVVGTFAFYFRTSRGPSELERLIVKACVHLCAIALEHEAIQSHNHELAYYDPLTNLPNRSYFNQTLRDRLAREHDPFGLLLIDIDHLKAINDTLGHAAGDAIIQHAGDLIRAADLPGPAFRLGGDEFAVMLDACGSPTAMALAAARLQAIRTPFQYLGHTLLPRITVGGALSGKDGGDAETLFQNADFALYHAKETNRGGYVQFRQGLRTSITRRINTIRAVDESLSDNRIVAHYQPIMHLETGEIVGLEALARLRTPENLIVPASEFVQALTDPIIAHRLSDQMLTAIAADMRTWIDSGVDFRQVSFNVTTGDFQRGDLDSRIVTTLANAGVPLHHLLLEVTESVLMGESDKLVANTVKRLRDSGVRVALDDFGTGFASLTHLITVPVDVIKIERSFIARMPVDKPSNVIVAALIDIAGKLDMQVVAEGIETEQQAEHLRSLGCLLGQGYLFARPAPAAIITPLLKTLGQPRDADTGQPAEELPAAAPVLRRMAG